MVCESYNTLLFLGCGMTEPDPSKTIVADGVSIPIGEGVPATCGYSSLLYNEYPLRAAQSVIILCLLTKLCHSQSLLGLFYVF